MKSIQNIYIKIFAIVFLGTGSPLASMTLENSPQEIKNLIVHHVIEQSDSGQQMGQTLTSLSRTSHAWHATIRPYIQQNQTSKNIIAALKGKCLQNITTIISTMKAETVASYRDYYHKTKPSDEEFIAIITYITGPMNHLDIQFKNTFDLLTSYYSNTPEASISCFYDLLKLYKLNHQYPIDPATISQNQIHSFLKEELTVISQSLFIQYTQTLHNNKRRRIAEIITFLNQRNLFTCPSINFQKELHQLASFDYETYILKFLNSRYCTQEDIIFLNQTINLKKHLRYRPLQSIKTALTNTYDLNYLSLHLIETSIASALIIKAILVSATLISLQKSMGTKKMLYTLSKMSGTTIIKVITILSLYNSFGHHALPSLIILGAISYHIISLLGPKCIKLLCKNSPLVGIATIALFLHTKHKHEIAVYIKNNLKRKHIAL